jgi:hypothetical protein
LNWNFDYFQSSFYCLTLLHFYEEVLPRHVLEKFYSRN